MDLASSYFLIVLALQAVFTAAVVLLVGRRFPARLRLYRWVAPAAVPMLLFLLVAYAYVSAYRDFLRASGMAFDAARLAPLGQFALSYAVLWLIGVLWGQMLCRLVLRRR